jgi:hypothetical protein
MHFRRSFLVTSAVLVFFYQPGAYAGPGGGNAEREPTIREPHFREPRERSNLNLRIEPRPNRTEFERNTPQVQHGGFINPKPIQQSPRFHPPQYTNEVGTTFKLFEVDHDNIRLRPGVERSGETPPRSSSPGFTINFDGQGGVVAPEQRQPLHFDPLPSFGPPPIKFKPLPVFRPLFDPEELE